MSMSSDLPRVEDCYRRHSRDLWSFFYGLCSDSERAWEAVQESFLKFQSQSQIEVRDERAWLAHVGRNWLRDFSRRRQNSECAADELDHVAADAPDPVRTAALGELREQVRQALGALRSDDREILLLRYALGWPSARMASILGIQVAAVDMRLTRARQRLAAALDELGIHADCVA